MKCFEKWVYKIEKVNSFTKIDQKKKKKKKKIFPKKKKKKFFQKKKKKKKKKKKLLELTWMLTTTYPKSWIL